MQVVMVAWVMAVCKNSRIPHVFKVWGQFGLDVKYLAEAAFQGGSQTSGLKNW